MTEGAARHDDRGMRDLTSYMPTADPGRQGGGTYTSQATEPTITDYENVFGPSARDIKTDLQRYKRHGRWHLPDALKGPNPWLTDRIDGLITDATNSPFTTKILPYKYLANPDGKLKWNVWSFDEGMASRVPYESAARTLTQSKRSFAGYVVRQGLAIVLEHNFMMSEKGRENFRNQLQQLIGSIQYTTDLDVHMALVLAPSYQRPSGSATLSRTAPRPRCAGSLWTSSGSSRRTRTRWTSSSRRPRRSSRPGAGRSRISSSATPSSPSSSQ